VYRGGYNPTPVFAPVAPWTGCYVGFDLGGAASNIKYTFDPGTGAANIEPLTAKPVSFFGGGHVGCEYQMSSLVAGIEGTWSGMNLAQTNNGLTVASRSRTVKIEQIATATGRLGFAWDWSMIYAKGGFAEGNINFSSRFNPADSDSTAWQNGWTAGAGFAHIIWQELILGFEFNYYQFRFDRSFTFTDGSAGRVFDTQANIYAGTARVTWLFNTRY
jgi:outer membrane immunogenic protein